MKSTLTILILSFVTICHGQTSETKYFNSEWLGKEVAQDKAKFSQTIIQNVDGTVTTEVKDLKKNEIISRQTFKGEEPYGVWKYKRSNRTDELDYSFDLIYADTFCKDSISGIKDYFTNSDSLNYIAPTIEGDLSIFQFIVSNVVYPPIARDNGISGRVFVAFTLTADGKIENIVVLRGKNILLDKEAVRVIRQLKFKTAPTVNGQSKYLCLTFPISFMLK